MGTPNMATMVKDDNIEVYQYARDVQLKNSSMLQ